MFWASGTAGFSIRRLLTATGVCALAILYLVLAVGIPLPNAAPQSSERFPCEGCPCGCRTAEQCWANCCCFSMSERLAWAKKNGVTPPAWVVARAECSTSGEPKSCCCCKKEPSTDQPPTSQVAGWQALRCQGKTGHWLTAVPTVLPQVLTFAAAERPDGLPRPASDLIVGNSSAAPPVPPPEPISLA